MTEPLDPVQAAVETLKDICVMSADEKLRFEAAILLLRYAGAIRD